MKTATTQSRDPRPLPSLLPTAGAPDPAAEEPARAVLRLPAPRRTFSAPGSRIELAL